MVALRILKHKNEVVFYKYQTLSQLTDTSRLTDFNNLMTCITGGQTSTRLVIDVNVIFYIINQKNAVGSSDQ